MFSLQTGIEIGDKRNKIYYFLNKTFNWNVIDILRLYQTLNKGSIESEQIKTPLLVNRKTDAVRNLMKKLQHIFSCSKVIIGCSETFMIGTVPVT